MNRRRVLAIFKRHVFTLKRNPADLVHYVWWPAFDAILFSAMAKSQTLAGEPTLLTRFVIGALVFQLVINANIGVSTSFFAEGWSSNALNLMVTPLTEVEWLVGVILFSLGRV